ncbi:MAG TPA: isoprenylcysteine carboxylmethyltransferase family protein [Actinomycetales bacterium]|nr:isoprenylcysteine carboxylmethyltransferase family protein [Actinomycetales bacterium]
MSKSNCLTTAQAASMAGLFWPGRAKWKLPKIVKVGAWLAVAAGGAVAAAGALEQGEQLTSSTTPPKRAQLITSGPYAHSRHPIYVGLLVAGSGFALLRRRIEPLIAFGSLATVLHRKVDAEENALVARFGKGYKKYAKRTPRMFGPY